jgi:hypothetical protein
VGARRHQVRNRLAGVAGGDQTLADEHGVGTGRRIADQVVRAADAGLGHLDHTGREPGRDLLEGGAVDVQGGEVAGVDPDDGGPRIERAVGLALGVHLDQGGHAQRLDPLEQTEQRVLLEGRDDQQDDVGAVGPRLVHLVAADDEVLAQDRHVDDRADGVQVGLRSAEAAPLGQHADDPGTPGCVLHGEVGGIGDRGEVALRGAPALDLGDHADARGAQRGERVQSGTGVEGGGLHLGERTAGLADGEVLADAGHDLVEHGHGCSLTISVVSRTSVPSPAGWVDPL